MTLDRPVTDDLDALLRSLPPYLDQRVRALDGLDGLLEVVMDLGRLPEARFADREEDLTDREVSPEDIAFVMSRIGQFGGDDRAGIDRALHRISRQDPPRWRTAYGIWYASNSSISCEARSDQQDTGGPPRQRPGAESP